MGVSYNGKAEPGILMSQGALIPMSSEMERVPDLPEENGFLGTKYLRSDVMIVKYDEDDYYVSEKRAGMEVYYKLLEDRSRTSAHYPAIGPARTAAEEMRTGILPTNPDCQVVVFDIADFMKIDVMIVKCDKDDYLVSTKSAGWQVSVQFLTACTRTAEHYDSFGQAWTVAEMLRQTILRKNPDCKVDIYDMQCFLDPVWAEQHVVRLLRDTEGNILFGIRQSGKKVPVFREGEEKYRYIDLPEYNRQLDGAASAYKNRTEFDYYNLGVLRGFEAASGLDLSKIRYEIFKAEKLICSFADDPEMFDDDIRFYSGYIESLKKSISIQKACAAPQGERHVHLLNLSGKDLPTFPSHGVIENLGSYTVTSHETAEEMLSAAQGNDIYIVFLPGKTNIPKLREELGFSEAQCVLFTRAMFYARQDSHKAEQKRISLIPDKIKTCFHPDNDVSELTIPANWVEGLEFIDDDDEDDPLF